MPFHLHNLKFSSIQICFIKEYHISNQKILFLVYFFLYPLSSTSSSVYIYFIHLKLCNSEKDRLCLQIFFHIKRIPFIRIRQFLISLMLCDIIFVTKKWPTPRSCRYIYFHPLQPVHSGSSILSLLLIIQTIRTDLFLWYQRYCKDHMVSSPAFRDFL